MVKKIHSAKIKQTFLRKFGEKTGADARGWVTGGIGKRAGNF